MDCLSPISHTSFSSSRNSSVDPSIGILQLNLTIAFSLNLLTHTKIKEVGLLHP